MAATKRYFLIILLIAFVITTGCQGRNSKKEAKFYNMVAVKDLNTKIRFKDPETAGVTFVFGRPVILTLENLTSEKIILAADLGIRTFVYNSGGETWMEFDNVMRRYQIPDEQRIFPPKGPDSPGTVDVGVLPNLQNKHKPIEVRVFILAATDMQPAEQVGAYVDVTLQP